MKAWFVVTACVLAASTALAHHSNSAFDPEKVVVLKGTVKAHETGRDGEPVTVLTRTSAVFTD